MATDGEAPKGDTPEVAAAFPAMATTAADDKNPDTVNAYSVPPLGTFKVRGPAYDKDRVKVESVAPVFEMVYCEAFRVVGKLNHVAGQPNSFIQRDRVEVGPGHEYLIIVYQTPEPPWAEPPGSRFHLVMYFRRAIPAGPPSKFDALWKRFREGDDAFRVARWKVLPHLADGPWAVSFAMGSKPALLASKLRHTWHIGADYVEIDCDVGASLSYLPAISTLIGLLQQYASRLIIDTGFAVQAEGEDELPEVVVACARLHHMSPAAGPVVTLPPEVLEAPSPKKK